MESLVQADIFFLITTIAVVGIAAVFIVALIYMIKILQDIRYISRRLKEESDLVIEDLDDLRAFLKKKGMKVSKATELVSSFTGVFSRQKKSSRKSNKK